MTYKNQEITLDELNYAIIEKHTSIFFVNELKEEIRRLNELDFNFKQCVIYPDAKSVYINIFFQHGTLFLSMSLGVNDYQSRFVSIYEYYDMKRFYEGTKI